MVTAAVTNRRGGLNGNRNFTMPGKSNRKCSRKRPLVRQMDRQTLRFSVRLSRPHYDFGTKKGRVCCVQNTGQEP
jgi:hypothetical protein